MRSFPWDSVATSIGEDGYPVYDRVYQASDLREVYETFFSNGIFTDSETALKVSPGEGMTVRVAPGRCCINGTVGYEEEERELALTASGTMDRIDTVVLRWDSALDARSIDLYVLAGAPSETPVRPTLTRSETVWELGLCDVYVTAHMLQTKAEKMTDTRLDSSRCGVVAPFVRLDTSNFYDQLQEQTQIAVDLAQAALDGTVVGQLQDDIDGKVSKSGDTMTGDLVIARNDGHNATYSPESALWEDVSAKLKVMAAAQYNGSDGAYASLSAIDAESGAAFNWLRLRRNDSILGKPLSVSSGGTGGTTTAAARTNLSVPMIVNDAEDTCSLRYPDGSKIDDRVLQAPEYGIFPVRGTGGEPNANCRLGMTSNPWFSAAIKNLYIQGSGARLIWNGVPMNSQGVYSFGSQQEVIQNNLAAGGSVNRTCQFTLRDADNIMDVAVLMGEQWYCAAYVKEHTISNGVLTVTLQIINTTTATHNCSVRITALERYMGVVNR